MKSPERQDGRPPLRLLSVVIPACNEEGCIAATVEHLDLELHLKGIDHEIVVVDDGSMDATWSILCEVKNRVHALVPVRNDGRQGFGRARLRLRPRSRGCGGAPDLPTWCRARNGLRRTRPRNHIFA